MANEVKKYFFGQGKLNLAVRDALGNRGKSIPVGDVETAEISLNVEYIDNRESQSGLNGMNVHHAFVRGGQVTFNAKSFDLDNLALGLYGTKVTVNTGTVTSEELPAGLAVGDEVFLKNPKASSIVITDSAGSPATLVANTDYQVLDAVTGKIKILSLGSYTQPFEVAYSYGERKDLGIFAATPADKWLVYEGINVLTGSKVLLDLYRVSLNALGSLPLINTGNAVGQFPMTGMLLVDETKSVSDALGQFGVWRDLA